MYKMATAGVPQWNHSGCALNINKDENKSFISNQFSLKKHLFPPFLGELFCEGKNQKVKNDHKSFLREN
jgi:hypothetical protein